MSWTSLQEVMFITVCLYLATLDSLSQHISFRHLCIFINNASIHVIVQLFKHSHLFHKYLQSVLHVPGILLRRATDYTQFLASRSLSKVSIKCQRDIDETSCLWEKKLRIMSYMVIYSESISNTWTNLHFQRQQCQSLVSCPMDAFFISPCLSNRLNLLKLSDHPLEIKKNKIIQETIRCLSKFR